ncbi:catalase family peroxidase [Dyella halodurans]|uniref:Catalase-related peroxidase n=1 Tax=Dyella halodurans TaxID=1920171 RepID=A0ABV9C3A0_9GAMM|nr:catalase family peroxidase [Dyella halodurans]
MPDSSDTSPPPHPFLRWTVIAIAVTVLALAFAYVAGWLTPQRLTPQRMVSDLQTNSGLYPGFRRNHAKGVCVAGYFEGNGAASAYSTASVFEKARTPVIGRFSIPGGNPYAPDGGTPVRALGLRFNLPNGQQWRTAMINTPVFIVSTPAAFNQLTVATRPDPATGKPDPARAGAFFASHPETAAFLGWAKTNKPSASFATDRYDALNAFYFVDTHGQQHAVRWRFEPEAKDEAGAGPKADDNDYLSQDLRQRLATTPQRWHLLVTLAAPGDPTNDATKMWPADRTTIDAGTLVIESEQAQDNAPCRDINFDPTILPAGIVISDDPLLPARSAAYADSYLRRTREEARLPGVAHADTPKPETK